MRLDLHTAGPNAPSHLLPTHTSAPERRAEQPRGRRTAAHQNSMGASPPMTPPHDHCPLGEGRGGVQVRRGPRRAVQGPPLIPPPPGAAPRPRPNADAGGECADDKRGARVGNRGPPPRGGAGSPRRDLPPYPPTGPQAAGAPAPTPRGRGGGLSSPRQRQEPEHGPPPRPSRRLPQEPRGASEPAPTRQYTAQIAPREGRRAQTGVVWGPCPP